MIRIVMGDLEFEVDPTVDYQVCQNTLAEALRSGHKPAPRRSAGVQPEAVGNRKLRREAARRRGKMNS